MHNLSFDTKYYKVDRCDIAYLRFIVESYEGLATLSTVDARKGIVSLSAPRCFAGDVDLLVRALGSEIPLKETAFPGEDA